MGGRQETSSRRQRAKGPQTHGERKGGGMEEGQTLQLMEGGREVENTTQMNDEGEGGRGELHEHEEGAA